jgi:aminocarboxymuconate-semialdehyde decarboxylase
MTIIDTQTHWYPRLLWEAYLDQEEYPRCRRNGDGYAYELAPDRWFPIEPHFYELELQLEAFDAAGIDAVVSSSASYGDVDRLPVEQAKEVAYALNEQRASAEREYKGRFYGLATIPWQDTEAALELLDDAVRRLGLRGVLVHSNIAGRPIDSEHCRPVYRRIAELGVPVFIHPARTIAEERMRDYGLEYVLGFMFDTSIAALRLVFSGLVEELPELKIVHTHCGATLPYLAGRIDHSYAEPYSLGRPFSTPPSEQLASFFTDTMSQSPETLAFARRFYEPGHMLFGSDYPYFSPEQELRFAREALDRKEESEAVLYSNAAHLLGLELKEAQCRT